ncbi:MAG: hypothetical protein OZ934_14270 [Anaerolineae bacterium]|nr:hypothetical protein [Anaerolineae bacterium]
MGIRLDWQVESEQSRIRPTEDPAALRRRQRARRQIALLLALLVSALGLIGALILWRLQHVDDRIRRDLLDTVSVEVTALRVGDFANYMAVQRSSSDYFILEQSQRFDDYQALKASHRVSLAGEVISATIDKQRARVVLEEIIDGVPYHVVWFYWRYEDGAASPQSGWRHVPDDLTFWGEEHTLTGAHTRITYRELDRALAQALLPRLDEWWRRGCAALTCAAAPPPFRVEIVAERPKTVEWASPDPWLLRISSPLVGRARADLPLAPELQAEIVRLLAARLVRYVGGETTLPAYSDAAWLQSELAGWLAEQMDEQSPAAPPFTRSLIAQYGPGASLTLLAALGPQMTLDDALTALSGVAMPLLTVDQLNSLSWESFLQWRLALEPQLVTQPQHSGAFLALYDLQNVAAAGEAALRLESPAYAAQPVPQIVSVSIGRDADSQTYAYAETTRSDNGVTIPAGTVIWRLSSGTWKRVN